MVSFYNDFLKTLFTTSPSFFCGQAFLLKSQISFNANFLYSMFCKWWRHSLARIKVLCKRFFNKIFWAIFLLYQIARTIPNFTSEGRDLKNQESSCIILTFILLNSFNFIFKLKLKYLFGSLEHYIFCIKKKWLFRLFTHLDPLGQNCLVELGEVTEAPWASLVTQWERICLPLQETQVPCLGQEDPLEKEIATHSSILAWKIPWTERPGGLYIVHRVAKEVNMT